MEVSLTQSRSFFGRYKVNCTAKLTEVEHAVILTQGMTDRVVLDWWTWNGEAKEPAPVLARHLMKRFTRAFKTQGEANHFQEQLQSGIRQFKEYLTYSSKPVPPRSIKL